jgi:hypothetical protein
MAVAEEGHVHSNALLGGCETEGLLHYPPDAGTLLFHIARDHLQT